MAMAFTPSSPGNLSKPLMTEQVPLAEKKVESKLTIYLKCVLDRDGKLRQVD